MVRSTQNNRNSDTIEPSYSNEDFNIGKSNHRIYKLTYGKSGLVKFIEKLFLMTNIYDKYEFSFY